MLPSRSTRPPLEELIIYLLLVITGATATIGAVRAVGPVEAEATLGFLMIVTGLVGVVAYVWRLGRGRAATGSGRPALTPAVARAAGSRRRPR